MKARIILLWLLCIATSAMAQQKKYTLRGNLRGSNVPMKVFLSYRDGDRKVTDSTMAKNHQFTFTGTLSHAAEATVYVHWLYPPKVKPQGPLSEGEQLMLEDTLTTIEGERLYGAKIKGGKVQQEYVQLHQTLSMMRDSVYRIWKSQQEVLPEDSALAFKRLLYAQHIKLQRATEQFIRSHPKSEMAFHILQANTVLISDMPFVEMMISILRPEFGNYERFKAVEQKVSLTKKLSVGQPAIDFMQADQTGKTVSLADVKGRYVLIDFWASWCGPCRTEYPFLKSAYAKYKEKNFEIVGVSIDDKKSDWLSAIQTNGFEWIQLSDLKGRDNAIARAYGIAAIPQNFLIDPNGKIIAKNMRGEELLAKLAELMR